MMYYIIQRAFQLDSSMIVEYQYLTFVAVVVDVIFGTVHTMVVGLLSDDLQRVLQPVIYRG